MIEIEANMDSNSLNVQQLFGLFDQNKDGVIDINDIVAVSSLPNAPPLPKVRSEIQVYRILNRFRKNF